MMIPSTDPYCKCCRNDALNNYIVIVCMLPFNLSLLFACNVGMISVCLFSVNVDCLRPKKFRIL
jgi:hypothetical protein